MISVGAATLRNFKSKVLLRKDDIKPHLSTKRSVSVNIRALEFLYDYVSINIAKFSSDKDYTGEVWGVTDDECIYIIKAQFDKILESEGYSPAAFLSWAKSNNVIDTECGRTTKNKRVNGGQARCVCLYRDKNEISLLPKPDDGLPF